MKPRSRWTNAHVRLKQLYEARVPEGMTQREFGRLYDIGSQGFVGQILNGIRPLNYELAAKFAKGLNCTIYDICPEMGDAVRDDLLPVLGKAMRRAAVLLLTAMPLSQLPSEAEAGDISHNHFSQNTTYYTMCNSLIKRFIMFVLGFVRIVKLTRA